MYNLYTRQLIKPEDKIAWQPFRICLWQKLNKHKKFDCYCLKMWWRVLWMRFMCSFYFVSPIFCSVFRSCILVSFLFFCRFPYITTQRSLTKYKRFKKIYEHLTFLMVLVCHFLFRFEYFFCAGINVGKMKTKKTFLGKRLTR